MKSLPQTNRYYQSYECKRALTVFLVIMVMFIITRFSLVLYKQEAIQLVEAQKANRSTKEPIKRIYPEKLTKGFLIVVLIVSSGPTVIENFYFPTLEVCKIVEKSFRTPPTKGKERTRIRHIYNQGGGSKLSYISCTEVLTK